MKLKTLYGRVKKEQSNQGRPEININEVKAKFDEMIEQFKGHGDTLYNMGKYREIAEYFNNLAENAEHYLVSEDSNWFDNITVKRNLKELKSYANDFARVSGEAQSLQERMAALYEDMGVILNRYFDVPESSLKGQTSNTLRESESTPQRPLSAIARDIYKNWNPVNYAAKPYLQAMSGMNSINDKYGYDDGRSVVLYFLSNASSWRGDKAKEIKNELKALVKSTGYKIKENKFGGYADTAVLNEVRSIGAIKIKKLKSIVKDVVDKTNDTFGIDFGNVVYKVEARIPKEWYNVWESAHDEIRRLVRDEVIEALHSKRSGW